MTRRRRGVFVWLLAAGLSATVAMARPGIVRTTDGQTFEGDVTVDESDANIVIVTVRGIPMRLERSRIASTEYTEGYEKQFADKMAKLAPNDVQGRLALAREALDQRHHVLAREAAEAARTLDPNNADAVALLETIRSQIRLEQTRSTTQSTTSPAGTTGGRATAGGAAGTQPTSDSPARVGNITLLSPADINVIRQMELRAEDRNVRIRFDRDVSRRFMRYANLQPREWNLMPDTEKVQRILTQGTPEMQRDVLILNDPPTMFQFRRQVQPWVLQNCATSGCHGGTESAKLNLVVPGDSDAAAYTNFYLMQSYKKKTRQADDALFGRGDMRLIDRQRPEQSLLLQNALPGAIAEFDHPDVANYKPSLRSTNDTRYRAVLDWIGSLRPVDTNYGIEPEANAEQSSSQPAATQPATGPATRPAN